MSSKKDQAPGTKKGQDVNGSKTSKNKTNKAPHPPVKKPEIEIMSGDKKLECLRKTGLFDSFIAKGVETTILGDKITLSGQDKATLKMCRDKVNASLDKVKCKSTDITDLQAQLLTKDGVVVFIDNHLGMKDKTITWGVVAVHDQFKLNVYAVDKEKKAADISREIMACITEEKVSMEESKNEWFQNMLKKESSKLVTGKAKGGFMMIIYSTVDIHNKYWYFTEPRQKTKSPDNQKTGTATRMSPVPCQNPITNHVGQPSTERDKAVESTDQPDLSVTGLAATANQPSDNTLATASSTTNFNCGNQPTNQLSQAQRENGTSQNAESAPGTQTDLNQPEPVTCVPLSYWLLQYFEKFGWHKVDDICHKNKVKYTVEGKRLLLNGNQKSAATVRKEIDDSLESLQEQIYCGKPFLPEGMKQKWIKTEKDNKCLIATESSEKPVHGWVIKAEASKMHILYMMGSITLADVDVILCPVTGKLEPIDDATDTIRTGFDSSTTQNKAFQIQTARPEMKYKTGDLLPLYDTGNLKCHCLLLSVQDQLTKGVGNHSDELAKSIMSLLESSGYQSFGLSLGCDQNPEWQEFSFSLISHLWRHRSRLKFPIILYCFDGTREIFDKLDEFLGERDKIEKYLDPFTLDLQSGQECGTSEIEITVEEGSILECSNKIDVIVNSVSASLDLQYGFVSKELVKKAGDTIQKECNDQHKEGIDIGDIAVTSAGKLKNHKKIFHVALHTSWIFNGNLSIQILKTLMTRCLKEAEERKLSSIAFPALGTGTLGYPPCLTAKTMFDAVEEYQKTNPKYLKTVHFVLFKDKEILSLFQNVKDWRKKKTQENGEVEIPPKNVMYVEKDLETRVFISERDNYRKLSYKELRVVFEEKHSQGLKLEWDIYDGCYATDIQITYSKDGLRICFRSVIHLMEQKKFHIVDIFLPPSKTPGMPLQTQFKIFIEELTTHGNKIKKMNASAGKKTRPVIDYVKVVRIFLSRDQFDGVVKEYKHWKTPHEGDKPVWHFTEKTAFPFRVTVVGKKTDTKNILKKVLQDVSSIEATVKFSLKIKESESSKAKKKIDKLRKNVLSITFDEKTNQVECEGTPAQVGTARQELNQFEETDVRVKMTEDDYAALLCFPEVSRYMKSHRYQNGHVLFEINRPDNTDELIQMIQSKIHELNQLATAEVIPPNQFEDQFPAIQKQVEQINSGILCFLSLDKKKIIIKTNGYEQVQQAKYKTEVHLGMVQQSAGRRNRKIASPDDYGTAGPSLSQSSVSEPAVKDGRCFTTKEGIKIYVYCAGIGHLEVDVLVNAANKDLQHGGGIAYHISRAAGYDFDKECDDYIRYHGPLGVGTCCSTTAGKLPYHSIIHAVGPMWHSYQPDQKQKCLDDLKMTILSALKEAHQNKYKSIAIPSISSGIFGVPKDLCTQQYQKAVMEYSNKFHRSTTIKEIHFVDIDKGMCSLIQKTFGSEFGKGIKM